MATRTPEQTAKMGLGNIKRALSIGSPEEQEVIRQMLAQVAGLDTLPAAAPAPVTEEAFTEAATAAFVAAATADAPAVQIAEAPQQAEGKYIDHSEFRTKLQARIDTLKEQINRSTVERQIDQWGAEIRQLQWCIDRSVEADTIPVHKSRWGNDGRAKGLHVATHDMLDTPRPLIKFSLYRFETDKPFRIACLQHYATHNHMTNTRIFEIPLGHEAYCDMDGQFVGFAEANFVFDLVEKGRAKRPRP